MKIGDLIKWTDSFSRGAKWGNMIGIIVSDERLRLGVYPERRILWQDGRSYEVNTSDIKLVSAHTGGSQNEDR